MQAETLIAPDGISAEPLRSPADLERLAAEWRHLWQRCPNATPFQSPDWAIPWWRHYGEGDLLALAMRKGRRLIAFAPLYMYRGAAGGDRQVFLIGTGNSDYLDLLCEESEAEAAVARVFTVLAAQRHAWDLCEFQQLRAGSPLLEAALPKGWRDERSVQEWCPVLPLPGAADRAKAMWREVRYGRRRAARRGDITIERAGECSFAEIFGELLRLHEKRWRARGLDGVLATERDRAFHREAAEAFLRHGMLRLYALRVEERTIGVLQAFQAHRRTYFYLGGFDPDFAALSPGTMLIAHAIEAAEAEDAGEFDFLRGREGYKYRWGAADRTNSRRRLWLA